MTAARNGARISIFLLFLFLALTPTSAFAFSPPDPNNPGKHTGEYLHNPHMLTSQAPTPGGANGSANGGLGNSSGVNKNGSSSVQSSALPDFQFQMAGAALPQLTAGSNLGQDAWLVVIILAALIAANIAVGVIYVSRGGHYLIRRGLRPAPAAA